MATTATMIAAAAAAAQAQKTEEAKVQQAEQQQQPQQDNVEQTKQSAPLTEEKTTAQIVQEAAKEAEQAPVTSDVQDVAEFADEEGTSPEQEDLSANSRSRSIYDRANPTQSETKVSKKIIREMEQRISYAESIIADMQARSVSAATITAYTAHVEAHKAKLANYIAQMSDASATASGSASKTKTTDKKAEKAKAAEEAKAAKKAAKKAEAAEKAAEEAKAAKKAAKKAEAAEKAAEEAKAAKKAAKKAEAAEKAAEEAKAAKKAAKKAEAAEKAAEEAKAAEAAKKAAAAQKAAEKAQATEETETPTVKDDLATGTGGKDTVAGGADGDDLSTPVTAAASDLATTNSVYAGRVTTLSIKGDVTNVEIIDAPAYGNLTVNPDMSLALVLTGTTNTDPLSFKVKVSYANGSTDTISHNLNVEEGPQSLGWGLGEFYMLENDNDGGIVVEHGENHRKVYVSGSDQALTRADIAKMEGLSVNEINGRFFKENPSYGASAQMAVDEEVGQLIWDSRIIHGDGVTSDWLLLDRGYTYNDLQIKAGNGGESALHPLYFGAYGEGSDPVIGKPISIIKEGAENVVFDGLDFVNYVRVLKGANILFNDATVTERGMNMQNIDAFTLRNSEVSHVVDDKPSNGKYWGLHSDRESGLFAKNIDGLLIESTFFDHNGWGADYDYGLLASAGQPPSIYSHNVYIQGDTSDVTFRDNIVMRGAGDGAQLRAGGFVEDNIFIDNNNALLVSRGRGEQGNYSLVNGNVVTSGAHKETKATKGGLTQGITAQGMLSSFLDNVVTHLANPDDAKEKEDKLISHFAIYHKFDTPHYDDTIIYNWVGNETHRSQRNYEDQRIDGLDLDLLDETTIQRLAADLIGSKTATIDDLSHYLTNVLEEGGAQVETLADELIEYFRVSFEIDTAERFETQTLRFVPNDIGDGVRWDNRLNWTTETLPGERPGDSVDLAGNWVVYGGTATIKNLDLGDGGALTISHGRLDVTGALEAGSDGGQIIIDNAGQFWVNGYNGTTLLDIEADGGRFANTGSFAGAADLDISGDAQVLLGADGGDFALREGRTLKITGADADLGFDGGANDPSIMRLENGSILELIASQAGFSEVEEFFSGAYTDTSGDPETGIVIDGSKLKLDISDLAGGKAYAGTLLSADEITGQFSELDVSGLNKKQDLTVMVDYDLDAVLISLSQYGSGNGKVVLDSRGDEDNARDNTAIWNEMQSFGDMVENLSIVEL